MPESMYEKQQDPITPIVIQYNIHDAKDVRDLFQKLANAVFGRLQTEEGGRYKRHISSFMGDIRKELQRRRQRVDPDEADYLPLDIFLRVAEKYVRFHFDTEDWLRDGRSPAPRREQPPALAQGGYRKSNRPPSVPAYEDDGDYSFLDDEDFEPWTVERLVICPNLHPLSILYRTQELLLDRGHFALEKKLREDIEAWLGRPHLYLEELLAIISQYVYIHVDTSDKAQEELEYLIYEEAS